MGGRLRRTAGGLRTAHGAVAWEAGGGCGDESVGISPAVQDDHVDDAAAKSEAAMVAGGAAADVSDAANVETAAFQVGYESPSQFSRKYSRMFAVSPRRDVAAFKRSAA
ncbi:hypothetical protein [Granulicella arctica]|uniref:hypothetical protein n=1 Tax=Granulicella arctica TaxID=940613 RepID=UPI0021E0B7C9|nr:hypothetical protein [Granulicella arctica]